MGKPEWCMYGTTMESHGHPYALRCNLPSDHGGDHDLVPAHRLLWERFFGEPPPSQNAHLRPKDGKWLNLKMSNWEIVSLKQARQEQANKHKPKKKRTCRHCDELLPLAEFPENRAICTSCYRKSKSSSVKGRNAHVLEFACEIYQGNHYHLVNKDEVLKLWYRQFFDRLRAEHPTPGGYKNAVNAARAQLTRVVNSRHKETSNA